ncbi:MAG: AMP-binding protein [Planctomycetota bacterium]
MNATLALGRWAREQPDQPAIYVTRRGTDRSITFAELDDRTLRFAGALRRRGIGVGDYVALLAPISISLYAALIGVMRAGAVAVVVDPGAGLARMRAAYRRVKPEAVVGTRTALAITPLVPELRSVARVHLGARDDPIETVDLDQDAPALLTFSSGSTGAPSAVVRTHGLLSAQNTALQHVLRQRPGQRWLATLPIFVLAHLAEGATAVIADANLRRPGSADGTRLAAQIRRLRTDAVVASPSLLERLVGATDASGFKRVFTGGAPVLPSAVRRFRRLAPNGSVTIVYGSTEAEPIAHLTDPSEEDLERAANGEGLPVGPPCPSARIRVISKPPRHKLSSAELDGITLKPGEAGELIVAGTHVVRGYLDGQGDEQTKIRVTAAGTTETWHRTGDACRVDESGAIWLLGRSIAGVTFDGKTAYPFEVEAPVKEQLGVGCALVPGQDQPTIAVACDLAEELVGQVLGFPVRVIHVPRIPLDRRHNAKTDYEALAALVREQSPHPPRS